MKLSANAVATLLAKYHIQPPVTDERFLEHADVTRGTQLSLLCFEGKDSRKRLAVGWNRMRWLHECPISEDDAAQTLRELHAAGAVPAAYQEQHTLQHLLVRCSHLYLDEGLLRLRLAPVYLRENGYRIGSAWMWSKSPVTVPRRLEPDAHDKAAVFAHRA